VTGGMRGDVVTMSAPLTSLLRFLTCGPSDGGSDGDA
jgi:hypothetical protein